MRPRSRRLIGSRPNRGLWILTHRLPTPARSFDGTTARNRVVRTATTGGGTFCFRPATASAVAPILQPREECARDRRLHPGELPIHRLDLWGVFPGEVERLEVGFLVVEVRACHLAEFRHRITRGLGIRRAGRAAQLPHRITRGAQPFRELLVLVIPLRDQVFPSCRAVEASATRCRARRGGGS